MATSSDLPRRGFLKRSAAVGAGAVALGRFPAPAGGAPAPNAGIPLLVTSHSNRTGREALTAGWGVLTGGGSPVDAIERAANVIEEDPDDLSVGLGGLPNADGVVALDASIMDGRTYNAGAVAALERIVHVSSVARLVMERTDHVMLVGEGANAFARSFGFEERELLTEESRQRWLRWREQHSRSDDWGPPEHLVGRRLPGGPDPLPGPDAFHYGTTNVLAVNAAGDVAGLTTTSGLSWKIPGRVGDSPIIGAGLYVDNAVGAAGATGRGEDVIKSCASFYIVMRMRDGRTPQEACEDAVELIVDRYRAIGIEDYVPSEKFVAINRGGDYGCAFMGRNGAGTESPARMTVHHARSLEVYEGTVHHAR